MSRRANPQAMTYDQVEQRKERGVEGLRRMGESGRADNLESESVESFAERKQITIVNPRRGRQRAASRAKRKSKNNPIPEALVTAFESAAGTKLFNDLLGGKSRKKKNAGMTRSGQRRRKNGEVEDAKQMFSKFHGRRPETIEDVQTKQNDRSTLAGLGVLMFLRTDLTQEWGGKGVGIHFSEKDRVILACDPHGNQLYFLGGNQDIGSILPRSHVDADKDFIDVGACSHIIYTTDKDFDNFEEKDYQHEFGEETDEQPRLIFDRLNKQLYLVGGAYEVKREGIVN